MNPSDLSEQSHGNNHADLSASILIHQKKLNLATTSATSVSIPQDSSPARTKLLRGVSTRVRTGNGQTDYRASVTADGKHISLGSFSTEEAAHKAYLSAKRILQEKTVRIETLPEKPPLSFEKCVSLINYRDNGLYIPTPIYLRKNFIQYYFSPSIMYRFDIEDLFYYSTHKIMRRGAHLFVSDYGSQINIMSRYGLSAHSVPGRDYDFYNGDSNDLRYENIRIINRYHGVRRIEKRGSCRYKAIINLHSNYVVGTYDSEEEAAVAYNKAADCLNAKGITRDFSPNFVDTLSDVEYAQLYESVGISEKILNLNPKTLDSAFLK